MTGARALVGGVLAVGIGLAGCGPKAPPSAIRPEDAIVVLRSNVRDAQVFVDGRFITYLHAAGGGIAVAPGVHRFELRHDDYFSGYLELELGRAERRQVALELAPTLP